MSTPPGSCASIAGAAYGWACVAVRTCAFGTCAFRACGFRGCGFRACEFRGCAFRGCAFRGCGFRGCVFKACVAAAWPFAEAGSASAAVIGRCLSCCCLSRWAWRPVTAPFRWGAVSGAGVSPLSAASARTVIALVRSGTSLMNSTAISARSASGAA
ncbi:pentapeptide repeat-containing protein [Microbispora hainanensis]